MKKKVIVACRLSFVLVLFLVMHFIDEKCASLNILLVPLPYFRGFDWNVPLSSLQLVCPLLFLQFLVQFSP